ncbi:MAG: CoA transferase [Dehalococcoidia bacterium]
MSKPSILEGVRVLDFGRFGQALIGVWLGDWGAEVIKVEPIGGAEDRILGPKAPDGEALSNMLVGRNKKCITLDVFTPKGAEMLGRLVKASDVVIHNSAVGTPQADILAYDKLKAMNPSIILASVTGFGKDGPYANRPCFDGIAQAMGGGMSFTGLPGGPPLRYGPSPVDFSTATSAAMAIIAALYYRQKTGVGQEIDVALFDMSAFLATIFGPAVEYSLLGQVRPQLGNHVFCAFGDCFEAKDGWVMIAAIGNRMWAKMAKLIGREELAGDPRFSDDDARFQNRGIIDPLVAEWISQKTVDEAMSILDKARIPCGRVNNVADVINDRHLKERGMFVDLDYPYKEGRVLVPATPVRFSQTPARIETRGAAVGEHNQSIYGDLLELSAGELQQLKNEGVI